MPHPNPLNGRRLKAPCGPCSLLGNAPRQSVPPSPVQAALPARAPIRMAGASPACPHWHLQHKPQAACMPGRLQHRRAGGCRAESPSKVGRLPHHRPMKLVPSSLVRFQLANRSQRRHTSPTSYRPRSCLVYCHRSQLVDRLFVSGWSYRSTPLEGSRYNVAAAGLERQGRRGRGQAG